MDIHQQVLAAFQVEHKEQVEGLRSILSALREEDSTSGSRPTNIARWNEAFRMAHTLKGGARVCDLRDVEALGHRMESLFAGILEGSLRFDVDVARTVSKVLDDIEDSMAALADGTVTHNIAQTLAEIEHVLAGSKTAPAFSSPPSEPPVVSSAGALLPTSPTPPLAVSAKIDAAESVMVDAEDEPAPAPTPTPEIETVRVQTQHLDALLRSVDAFVEVNAEHDRIAGEFTRLFDQLRELQRQCNIASSKVAPLLRRQSDAPELGGVERHIDSITQTVRRLGRQFRSVRGSQKRLGWTVRIAGEEARLCTQRLRMITAENVLQGLAPMVRSLARDEGKEVEFRAIGLHVHADRSVLHGVKEAVVQALRNAIAHGIEPPQERLARGKDRAGQITLTLQTRGNQLQVLVEDDGRGINIDRVRQAAARQGFLPPTASTDASERQTDELMRLLFRPGLTTSDTVTELAGRGMGLSIVSETVARLHGSVKLSPRTPGPGTTLDIRVPLVISAERLLLVSCSEQIYAIPTRAVEGLLRVPTERVQSVGDRRLVVIDGVPLPLTSFLQPVDRASSYSSGTTLIVALRGETGRAGIIVDRFIAEREAMIKTLSGPAARIPCFCGAIVLEEGEAALVIDPAAAAASLSAGDPATADGSRSSRRAVPARVPKILVVDDSFTTRTLEKSILETSGYDVRIAVDGIEALRAIRHDPVDIVVADVQMPRMDGLSLLREIRSDTRTAALPVILVSSLDSPQDHERSKELGASAYIVKRRFDHQDLLHTIRRFL